ncbi:MAG: hypothetical protein ACR2P1_11500 [Pseudomonadales bacterium]
MVDWRRYVGQAVIYALFMVTVGYFSSMPYYQASAPDEATLKLSVRHAGKVIGECATLSNAQMENLPANMKVVEICPRERSPLRLELLVDGELLYADTVQPSGLHNDGVSSIYQRFTMRAGKHQLTARLSDDVNVDDSVFVYASDVDFMPTQVAVLQFDNGFRLDIPGAALPAGKM